MDVLSTQARGRRGGVWEDPNLQGGPGRNSGQSGLSGKSTFLQPLQLLHHSFAMHHFLFMLAVLCTFHLSLLGTLMSSLSTETMGPCAVRLWSAAHATDQC